MMPDGVLKVWLIVLTVILVVIIVVSGLIGYALAFPIAWGYENNPLVIPDGFKLYRHAGLCTDPIKKWVHINTYPRNARSGDARPPNPPAMRCYTLRAYKKFTSETVESEDSNLVQRMPVAPKGLQEVP